ncbi:hypothetical protein KFE25_013673 [Diacronema lutheri]|uniref:Uncharacterized protein n=1 Tax=Diacronema lutheri TaxID=2081491 RepID=A0A8J6CG20_DIALT|nr:hypothetical protein KFE25_013673 [Diacronema lutheri]
MGFLSAPADAVLNLTEAVGKKVEEVGYRFIPGFSKFDKAMQVVADKLNKALGLEEEGSIESGIVAEGAVRSDML